MRIDKKVPLPTSVAKGAGRKPTYPWTALKVGDSFFVPRRIASVVTYAALTHGIRLVARRVTEDGVTGTRVWRVS